MRITLESWASRNFERPPSLNTLRSWAASGLISDCIKVGRQWMPSHDSVYIEQPANVPESVSGRVADILRRAA